MRSTVSRPSGLAWTLRRRIASRGSTLPPQVKIIKAHLEVDELRERRRIRPQQRLALPSPRPAAVAIAVTVIEVQAGVRSPWHLERISHYSLWPLWDRFARPAPPDPAATAARALAVVVQELTPGLVDATVVIQFASTAHPSRSAWTAPEAAGS